MWKLHRYIAINVLVTSAIIFAVICGLYLIFTFIAEMGNVGQGDYGVFNAFIYVLLIMPSQIYLVLPIVALLGSLMGLGLLASHSELIAMRAAGVSIRKIAVGVLYANLLIGILAFVVGAYIGPELSQYATFRKAIQIQNQAILVTTGSTWLKEGNQFIYINKIAGSGKLYGIHRYTINEGKLAEVDTAKEAYYANNTWYMKEVTAVTFTPLGIVKQTLPETTWKSFVEPKLLDVLISATANLTLNNLWSYIKYRRQNGLNTSQYELSFWQTFFQPISVIVLGLLAVPFVFGPLRSANVGLRMIAGVGIGFAFFIINQFFGPLIGVYNFPPLLGAMLPTVLFGIILMIMIAVTG